jgi:hypothetical protein
MGSGARVAVLAVLLLLPALPALPAQALARGGDGPALPPKPAKAGVAVVDASWHVGASSGSHGSSAGLEDLIGVHGIDPARHSVVRVPSYGIQSRLDVRALVVEGANGKRVALVKNDLFIPQDLLRRRTAQILEEDANSGIGAANLTMAVSHDHSSPYHSSPDWGVAAASQDAFDARFYEYYAEQMARAVEKAAANLKPVRLGAAVSQFDKTARNSMGGEYTDDGTPGGYWANDIDTNMTIVRFDDVTNPHRPKPLAILMNWSMHPETLPSGLNLITGDYVAPLERMVDRESGATLIFTQASVGTSEPEESDYDQAYDSWHSVHDRLEFHYKGYEAGERAARLMADTALDTWRDIARGTPEDSSKYVPFQQGFEVGSDDRWFPGPLSHPYPSFGNCKLDPAVQGHPRAPTDLPTCEEQDGVDTGLSTDPLKQAGVPVPDHYSPPAYTGLEEDLGVHLQAFRLGDVLFTVCSCEQWKDQSQNIRTRTDRTPGNEYLGYDFSKECTGNGNGTWSCPDPFHPIRQPRKDLPPVSDAAYRRMKAEVGNDARGWDQAAYAPFAESEPENPDDIKGNYTHDDTAANAAFGYGLTVPISMANDYNGYLATYREYYNRDHYRKSLTGWGPHSSDYFATRMVEMGRRLNGGPELPCETGDCLIAATLEAKVAQDQAQLEAKAQALGRAGQLDGAAWKAALPDTPAPRAVTQPADVERFSAAFFAWNGGDNYTDNPRVVVERRLGRRWETFADQSGEVPVTVEYPHQEDLPSWAQGSFGWRWTAHFEAFVSQVDGGDRPLATPAGRYRFAVSGAYRAGHAVRRYRLVSQTFEVKPWSGITADDLRVDPDGGVSFLVGPRHTVQGFDTQNRNPQTFEIGPIDYPDSYSSPHAAKFVNPRRSYVKDPDAPDDPARVEWYCFACTFRPWLDRADAESAFVTIDHPDGTSERVPATESGGRWVASQPLGPGDSAYVAAGDVRDRWGDTNGAPSVRVP